MTSSSFYLPFSKSRVSAIAPEFLQEHCNGPELAAAVAALLDDPTRRAAQAKAQTTALAKLGLNRSEPFEAAADVVINVARARGLLDG